MEMSDAALLTQWTRRRDSDAFVELVVRHSRMVYSTCLRVLGNPADAEEVTQECFLELARTGHRVNKTHAGWLHSLAVKRSAFRIRSEVRRRAREKAFVESQPSKEEPSWEDIQPQLDACIAELPEHWRAAIVSRFLEGLTYEETGRRLGIPASTAQYRIEKGIEGLRGLMTRRGIVSSAAALAMLLGADAATGAPVPAGLMVSLGKMALAKGATAAAGAGWLTAGGLLIMKYAIALFAVVVGATGVAIGARSLFATEHEKQKPAAVLPSASPEDFRNKPSSPPSKSTPAEMAANATEKEAAPAIEDSEANTPQPALAGNVKGVAVHADTGKPAPGLVFSLRKYVGNSPYGGFKGIGTVETDSQGRFAFEGSDVTVYWLLLEDKSLALYDGGRVEIKQPGQVIDGLVFKVGPGASISGRVYDAATGQGIQGVKLFAYGGRRSVETDKDGAYLLAGLSGERGQLNLANTGQYVNIYYLGSGEGRSVELKRGQRAENVDFPLEKGIVLKGIVVNEAAEPMVGGDVRLQAYIKSKGRSNMALAQTKIGADGRFALEGVEPDTDENTDLRVSGTRTANDPEDKTYWPHSEHGKLVAWTGERRFVLEQAGRVCGTVLDTQSGKAISAFELFAASGRFNQLNMGWREAFKPVQDSQGRFCRDAFKGYTTLFARAEGYAPGFVRVETPTPGETVETELRLEPGGVIEGTVTDWNGGPVQGACIFDGLAPEGDRYAKETASLARSDNVGRFRVTVTPGERVFSAWTEEVGSDQVTASVAAGETANVSFKLGNGARISGQVTENGKPISTGVRYAIQPDAGGTKGGETWASDGKYRFGGLPAGHGTLTIMIQPPSGERREKTLEIETVDGSETVVDYDFPAISTTITGMVQLNGEPIPSASIVAYVKGQPGPLGTSSAVVLNGAYEISTELGGQITLAVSVDRPTGTYMHREAVEVEPGAAVEHDINIVTGTGATIEGQIIQVDLKIVLHDVQIGLVEGALRMEDREFEQYYMTTALAAYALPDANGHFRFEDIPDGDYTLVLKAATQSNEPWYTFNHIAIRNAQPQTVDLEIR